MGKASSSKKVARAARAGGKAKGQRKNIGFPVAVVAILLLGVGLVAFARTTQSGGGEPRLGDHWHAAYGVFVCDRWVTNLSDRGPDQLGIHTHDDGLIHIHPFLAGAAGNSATLGKFFDQVGMRVSDSSITLPEGGQFEGRRYVEGETTCGGEAAEVTVAYWADARTAGGEPDELITSGISGHHLDSDGGAFTFAFVPPGTDVPPPPNAAQIVELGQADGPTQVPGDDLTEEDLREQFTEGGGEVPPGDVELPPLDEEPPADDPAGTDPPAGESEGGATTEAPG